jgi:adenine-specific DNA-methyltransferase
MLEDITKFIGKPYYQSSNCAIYNLDCLEAMKKISAPFAHLTVTSPPYNIGKEYEKVLPLDDYLNWCGSWISEVHRLTVNTGAFWLNLGYISIPDRAKAIPLPYLLWKRLPFFLVQEIIWNYGAGVAGKRFFSPRNEKFLWYVKDEDNYTFNLDEVRDPDVKYPNQKKNGKIKVNSLGKNPSDVWQIPKVTSGAQRSSKERTPHPAQFPKALIERIIKVSSNTGEMVFDPFLGSGTTAIAALEMDRIVLGFEVNADYCQIAADRIERLLHSPKQIELLQWEYE